MSCAPYDEDYFMSVPNTDAWPEARKPPDDLVQMWAWAGRNKFPWIRLDGIGDNIELFSITYRVHLIRVHYEIIQNSK